MSAAQNEAPVSQREHAGNNLIDAPPRAEGARHPKRYALKGIISRGFNPIMRSLAGRRHVAMFAMIHHRGRRSGRAYATPVGARPTANGFVIPLTFGEGADWFRNVQAAGEAVIRWNGADYRVVDPDVVDWSTARPAFHPVERVLMPIIGIDRFARVRHAPTSEQQQDAPARPSGPSHAHPLDPLSI